MNSPSKTSNACHQNRTLSEILQKHMGLGLSFQHGGGEGLGRAELTQGSREGTGLLCLEQPSCLAGSISPCLLLDMLKMERGAF